jgi:putative transposase
VNPSDIDKVSAYIEKQLLYHAEKSFQDEYLALLKKYDVEYEERHLWD